MRRLYLDPTRRGYTNCIMAVSWSGYKIHRRWGEFLWCRRRTRHAGPPWPAVLAGEDGYTYCQRCWPAGEGVLVL